MRVSPMASSRTKPTPLARFAADRRGNVLMIMAFAMIPLTAATGMAIDYSRAARLQTKVNSAADAAALAAVTTPMMTQSTQNAAEAAAKMFINQVSALNGMTWKTALRASPTVTKALLSYTIDYGAFRVVVTDVDVTGLNRTATVSYDALSDNAFKGVLGLSKSGIGGSATATAKVAPDIDFFVLLDTSSSMGLPSTTAGLAKMKSLTPGQCAFACHQSNLDDANERAYTKEGKLSDFYGVAKSYGIQLRSDEASKAVSDMMDLAKSTAEKNGAYYRAALATFAASGTNSAYNTYRIRQSMTTSLSTVKTQANAAQLSLYYKNNYVLSSYNNNDTDTATSDAFTRSNANMATPGNGKHTDKPQGIMFVVTDGMRDEARPGGSKPEVVIDTALCDTIKARGIRIAILYTEYLPEAINNLSWATDPNQGNVLNRVPLIEPALQACASSGLYYKVTTDDDISAALKQLFSAAVATARLTD